MRLFPFSLRGQVLVVIVLALALAQALGLWLFSDERNMAVRAALTGEVLDRAANVITLLEKTPAASQSTVLAAANSPLIRFSVDANSTLDASRAAPASVLAQMHRRLSFDRTVRIRLHRPTGPADLAPMPGMAPGMERMHQTMVLPAAELQLSAQLTDGRWLNVTSLFHNPPLQWGWPDVATFAISAAVILAAVWWLLGRIIRPLRRLANAADHVGDGEWADDIESEGPHEVRRVTSAFNRMQTRLKRFINERGRILAALSHDLRSPLTALRVRAEMVDETETRDALISSIAEMQEMVEATLTYARGSGGSESMSVVDPVAFVETLVTEYREMGRPVALATDPGSGLKVSLRPISMRRALRNLIDNALRYAQSAKITISARDAELMVEITDDGPGMAEDDLERVFEPFVRLENSRSRETGGAGLGLAIARSIVRAHGGTLGLSNNEPKGLKATITLPMAPKKARPAAAAARF